MTEWDRRPRSSKLAQVLYPQAAEADTIAEMRKLASNEKKKAPAAATLLANNTRGAVSPLGGAANNLAPAGHKPKKGK